MQFHAIQHDVISGDYKATRACIEKLIEQAKPSKKDYIVLQEMADTGWSLDIEAITNVGTLEWASALAKKLGVWIQTGWAEKINDRAHNCAAVCSPDGSIVANYVKVFTCNPLGENKLFDKGNELFILHIDDMSICPLICYDLRFAELWRLAALEGVDVFTESSSWPLPRIHHWKTLICARAIENQAFVVGSNRSGKDVIAHWGGSSLIVSPLGEVLAEAPESGNHFISATIDPKIAQNWRASFPALDDVRKELLGNIKVTHIFG
jgi:omega-amidase